MSVQDKYAAQKKYDRANTQVFTFKLNKNTDASIIEWLNSKSNKQRAIKNAIMDAMNTELEQQLNLWKEKQK